MLSVLIGCGWSLAVSLTKKNKNVWARKPVSMVTWAKSTGTAKHWPSQATVRFQQTLLVQDWSLRLQMPWCSFGMNTSWRVASIEWYPLRPVEYLVTMSLAYQPVAVLPVSMFSYKQWPVHENSEWCFTFTIIYIFFFPFIRFRKNCWYLNLFFLASTMPSVTSCPSDMYYYSADRVTTITWTEPSFNNLGSGGNIQAPEVYRPGLF